MKEFSDMIFVCEVLLQSKIALRAFERLEATKDDFDYLEVWCSIQSILVSTGNVSKILWPVKNKQRGERLREFLQVGEDNILASRKFRNYFEHYDEKIDDWFKIRATGAYVDLRMNPSFNGDTGSNTHRGYNSFNNTLLFRGEVLDLNKLLDALSAVGETCKLYVLDLP